ncbi:hypothetical protein ACOSQ2_031344 [Xanthoceras sorbifolium]
MLEADLRLLTVVLWRVWFRPNKFVHEQVALPAEDVVTWSVSFVSDYVAAADGERHVAVPRKMYKNAYSLLQCEYLNSNFKLITTSHLLHYLSIQYYN